MYPWIWIQSILRKLWLPGYTVLIHFGGNWTSPGVQPVASKFGFNRASGGALNRVQTHMGVRVFCRSGFGVAIAAAALHAQQAPIPRADELPGQPYAIRNKWVIGGPETGTTLRSTPAPAGFSSRTGPLCRWLTSNRAPWWEAIGGFHQAHAVVLDDQGTYGYATDGLPNPLPAKGSLRRAQAGGIHIRGRRRGVRPAFRFRIVANILTTASLRALALDPQTGLLFALGTDLSTVPPSPEPAWRREGQSDGRAARSLRLRRSRHSAALRRLTNRGAFRNQSLPSSTRTRRSSAESVCAACSAGGPDGAAASM